MHKRHVTIVVIGAVLCLGALAAAQDNPPVTSHADKITSGSGRTTLEGNVVLIVNGVVVRADRAVIQGGEVALEGDVRLTLPKPAYTAAAMRSRIQATPVPAPPVPSPPVPSPSPRPRIIDTPIPLPWEPPAQQR